jgi:hypothetical protein
MLNPRAFAEDCLRLGKMDFWAQGMPWEAIDTAIDPTTFEYNASANAVEAFEGMTGRKWDNLAEPDTKKLQCPKCRAINEVPWSTHHDKKTPGISYDLSTKLDGGKGYAEPEFKFSCKGCHNMLNHRYLQFAKFKGDVEMLAAENVPLPATMLSIKGIPERVKLTSGASNSLFPNELIKKYMLQDILDLGKNGNTSGNISMENVRDLIEPAIKQANDARNRKALGLFITHINGRPIKGNLIAKSARISVRRMMARYWGNASPFGLDLVGAVIRQSDFM